MTEPTIPSTYAEWFERLRNEYGAQLSALPLPEGLPEHLGDLIARGDQEAILFMLRLAWQFGAQAGYAAAQQNQPPNPSIRA